jgi:hypothetical protein
VAGVVKEKLFGVLCVKVINAAQKSFCLLETGIRSFIFTEIFYNGQYY